MKKEISKLEKDKNQLFAIFFIDLGFLLVFFVLMKKIFFFSKLGKDKKKYNFLLIFRKFF